MKRCLFTLIALCWGFSFRCFSDSKSNQLMDLLGDDPSLLLEPSDTSASAPIETPIQTPIETAAKPVPDPEPPKLETTTPPAPPTEAANLLPPLPAPSEPIQPVVQETPVVQQSTPPAPKAASQLTVLSGVNDISIILSNQGFFPSQIKMKKTPKTRLIFTTTEKKPAALVFEKQKIYRWLASEASSLSPEYRELNPSRISEINFDAEPGSYRFYDAISGAAGEIQVE